MGVCCQASEQTLAQLTDLPVPSLAGVKDKIKKWELSLPWQRCYFKAYLKQVDAARDASACEINGKTAVRHSQLVQKFNTPAWKVLA